MWTGKESCPNQPKSKTRGASWLQPNDSAWTLLDGTKNRYSVKLSSRRRNEYNVAYGIWHKIYGHQKCDCCKLFKRILPSILRADTNVGLSWLRHRCAFQVILFFSCVLELSSRILAHESLLLLLNKCCFPSPSVISETAHCPSQEAKQFPNNSIWKLFCFQRGFNCFLRLQVEKHLLLTQKISLYHTSQLEP